MPSKNKKKIFLVIVSVLILLGITLGFIIYNISSNEGENNNGEEPILDQANAVVLTDIVVDSIDKIIADNKDTPLDVYSLLTSSGTQKNIVEKYSEALPYFQAALEYAQNDEQKIGTEIRIYYSAINSGNLTLAEEYKNKLGDNLTTPTVTGSSQDVE